MTREHNGYKLGREIVVRSVAESWDEAKLEWELDHIYRLEPDEDPETCLCGHCPIIEVCVLKNKQNGRYAIVGNVCVKKFIGLPSDLIFQAIKRVAKDVTRALNAEAIAHAHRKGWINDWERSFYFDTMRKRKLSDKQLAKRVQINRRLLRGMRR